MIESRLPISPIYDLRCLLQSHSIPIEKWGTGAAKRVEDLLRETLEEETELHVEDVGLVRIVKTMGIDVVYFDPTDNQIYLLKELYQRFGNTGRTRVRNMPISIGEKLKKGELPNKPAVMRALSEEIGITDEPDRIEFRRAVLNTAPSISYPGLKNYYLSYRFHVQLTSAQFNPDGYHEVENSTGLVSTFGWQVQQ